MMVTIMYSLVDWRRRFPNASDVDALGPECDYYPTSASTQIYYYSYPYRVDLESEDWGDCFTKFDERRSVALRKLMLEEFCEQELDRNLRSYISKNTYRVYLQTYQDLLVFLGFFNDQVKHVHGPVSADHIQAMTDPDYSCVIRGPYYKKFDIKIFVSTNYSRYGLYSSLGTMERQQIRTDVLNYLRENLPPDKQLLRDDLYTTSEDYAVVQPFITLQYPDARLVITKCILER